MNKLDFLTSDSVQQFIHDHEHANIQELLLNPPKEVKEHVKLIADQLLSRRKAKGKLDSWLEVKGLIFPLPLSVEQASSDLTAEYKKRLVKGNHLVDLTGGMGIDCLALSENFKKTTYVERDSTLCEVFEHNARIFRKDIKVVNLEAADFLKDLPFQEDQAIFLDPARRGDRKQKVFRLEDCSPNPLDLLPQLWNKAQTVLIKLSPLIDLKSISNQFLFLKEIHVISVKNECKEVLALIDFKHMQPPLIKTVNIELEEQSFDFLFSEEEKVEALFGEPQRYLYEPNSSILKAGGFKSIGSEYDLLKLHPNTHLYSHSAIAEKWPGRIFEVIEKKVDKGLIKQYASSGYINVITRNHPRSAKELKQKFKVKDGGDYFLIGFRSVDRMHSVIAKRVR